LSISASREQSWAMCPHAFTISTHPYSNSFCYYWNPLTNAVDAISMQIEDSFLLTRAQIFQTLSKNRNLFGNTADSGIKITFNSASSALTISSDKSSALFDLNSKDDFIFVAELQMVCELVSQLNSRTFKQFAYDEAPDHFAVSISTLRTILKKYGANSPHFEMAIALIDFVVSDLVQKVENLYEGRICSEIVVLGSDEKEESLKKEILEIMKGTSFYHKLEKSQLPQVFLSSPSEAPVGEELHKAFKGTNFEVVQQESHPRLHKRSFDATVQSNLTIQPYQLAQFHIVLWVPIACAIVLIAVAVSMMDMNSGKDSLLYAAPQGRQAQPPPQGR